MIATDSRAGMRARYVRSYAVRRAYRDAVQYPPEVPGVQDAIDIHCHAHEGQQDALAVAKHASASGMRGILFKTIVGRANSAENMQRIREELQAWADTAGVRPIDCWVGWNAGSGKTPPSARAVREQLDRGVNAIWLPNTMHANTLHLVGGRPIWWGGSTDAREQVPPLHWDEALAVGHYHLDEQGRLKPEILALAEEVERLGYKQAVVDHPFSPFVDLDIEQMQPLARAGIFMNFTYDEMSP